ncbi:nucleoside triphosphate pyrophosphohydrolase [Candidatus Sumerlaeota bacterium]|nr:nucleoside triphosphate pyrophosphohydrolase [Candidatus Sumerlaeota bacterium]
MDCLLAPEGCPWDRKQSHATLKPYVVEEAYEVCEAIDDGDPAELRAELGDLGLQIVFHSALARRDGSFNVDDVYTAICEKLIRRHPHVFGDVNAETADVVLKNWEAIKREERAAKNAPGNPPSALDGVPKALPALQRAQRLQGKAARVGFDWKEIGPVFAKVREEIAELEVEVNSGEKSKDKIAGEFGDLLFALVNLARFLDIDPEQALHTTNRKFTDRFQFVEKGLREQGTAPEAATLEEMDALWDEAKKKGV